MVDVTNIPPLTEEEAEALFEGTRPILMEEVERSLNDLPQESADIVRKYIRQLKARLNSVYGRMDELDRAQYRPGDGDMGG